MKTIILSVLIGLFAFPVLAQSKKGMHFENRTWVALTPQSALDAFHMKSRRIEYAIAVLRQIHSKHPKAELDALADELIRLFREGDYGMLTSAQVALELAGRDHGEGIPYERAKHLFKSVYEEKAGTDFVMALRALGGIFQSGGESMLRDMFHNSTKPQHPCTHKTGCPYVHEPWCNMGHVLVLNLTENSPLYTPLVTPVPTDPTPDDILPHCFGQRKRGDKWSFTSVSTVCQFAR